MSDENEILLIEDDEADVELALHALRENKLGNHIQVLRDGEEALDYLFGRAGQEQRAAGSIPRLILLDVKLPKVDGIEVLRRIKNDATTKFIPVVILTSSTEERDMVRGYDLGVNSYIQKPLDFDRFRELVGQVGLYWLVINQPAPARWEPAAA
jgi:two-component system, response regulator